LRADFAATEDAKGDIQASRGCGIPTRNQRLAAISYLEKAEIDALLAALDRRTAQGRRDHVLLLLLYNTGARASEVAHVKVADLDLNAASVKISGKRGKQRFCPLWSVTVSALATIIAGGGRHVRSSSIVAAVRSPGSVSIPQSNVMHRKAELYYQL
jgi:site-specific recombinase XerD